MPRELCCPICASRNVHKTNYGDKIAYYKCDICYRVFTYGNDTQLITERHRRRSDNYSNTVGTYEYDLPVPYTLYLPQR